MKNKELIRHIRSEAAKSTNEAFDLWMRVLKALQDAEDLLNEASEVTNGVIDKQAQEINRLKAEQVDQIELPKMYEPKKQGGTYFDKSKNKRLTAYQKGWNEAIKAVKKQYKKERS